MMQQKQVKIPHHFLDTTSHSLLHYRLEHRGWRIDRSLVLYRIGKALGMVQ
jgi:hypothetical protein